ncbi:biotin--[acetyl-CoA-carboxylase] ligase [Eggerthellaceae bacterium 3-80]|nr:biotin--[acetyl-CoA-carboxylase] ligase [bacterium D16-34]
MFTVRSFDEVTSTNDLVKRALEAGEPEGLVVRASKQTGGYGRQGRTWTSPEGGLYASFLLRPCVSQAELPTLSLVVALAVRRALAALADPSQSRFVQVKWPNDVVYAPPAALRQDQYSNASESRAAFNKLCGISLEAHAGGICVGIGINVVAPVEDAPVRMDKNRVAYVTEIAPAISSLDTKGALDVVFEAELSALQTLYQQWLREGFASFVELYNQHAALQGQQIIVEDRIGNILGQGCVTGIDNAGQLVLRNDRGEEVHIASGEAHVVPCM